MAPVKPTSTAALKPKAQPRAGENVVPKPTPTQEENDKAAAGIHVEVHEWDGTPLQDPHGTLPDAPDRPELPPPTAPVVNSLSPSSAPSGDPLDFQMVVNGTGFNEASVIVFNGYDEPTTFIDDTQVSTGVKPSLFVVPAEVPCSVRNGSKNSNQVIFTFT